jgi:hypothetical protein
MRLRFLGSAVLAAGLVMTAWVAHAQDVVHGTLEQVNTADATLVIRTEGRPRPGRLTPLTVITIGGMPGDVRDLRPGQRVTAHFALTSRGSARAEIVRLEVVVLPASGRSRTLPSP